MTDAPDALVRADCLREYFRQGATVSGAVVVVTGILSFRLWDHVPKGRVAAWFGAVLLLQIARVALGAAFRRREPAPEAVRPWGRAGAALSTALGFVLGVGAIWLSLGARAEDEIFMVFVLSAFSAGSLTVNAFNPPAMYAFLAFTGPPYILYLLWKGDPLATTTGVASTVYVVYLVIGGTRQARTLAESVRLRHERKALVAELQLQAGELQLQAGELKAQARALEEAGREKSRFFAAASHDLRQPVHALGLYASLLQQRPLDPEARGLARRVGACVDSLETLFAAILGVARAEAPAERPQPVALPVQRIVDAAVVQHLPAAEAKGLRLRVRRTRAWTRCDPPALERVLGNLLANAVRYTDRGGILVGVRHRAGALVLQVVDTGRGIAPEHRERIFEEFFQVENAARDRRGGLGLGLAIVRRLCEGMGWRLSVASRPGRGSTFGVEVPRLPPGPPAEAANAAAPAEAIPPTSGVVEPALPGAVLAVDDDPEIREAMARAFAEWGVELRACASAEEALDAVAAEPDGFRRFILDVRLGDRMNGLELALALSARGIDPARIMLLTGEAASAELARAREHGFLVLAKPVRMLRLRAFASAPEPSPAAGAA